MPSGFSQAGQANKANGPDESAYAATFTPNYDVGQLVVCGTALCKRPGLATLRVEYKQGAAPWQPVGLCSASGEGRVALLPCSSPVMFMPNEPFQVRVVIDGDNTETTEDEDYFSITLLELEQPAI